MNGLFDKIDADLIRRVQEKFPIPTTGLVCDHRGHKHSSDKDIRKAHMSAFYGMDKDELTRLDRCQGEPNPPILIDYCSGHRCNNCGWDNSYYFDGTSFVATLECKMPEGIKEVTIELNVPSGKMVFANDLREWFKVHGDFDINIDYGKLLATLAYEKVGMAHGFVGNTCLGVYRLDDSNLSISGGFYYEEDEDNPDSEVKVIEPIGEDVGRICTDLWWYCIVDFDDFKHRFFDLEGSEAELNKQLEYCDVVDVKPGVYQVTHYFIRNDSPKPTHYAKITWVREPEERQLYQASKRVS